MRRVLRVVASVAQSAACCCVLLMLMRDVAACCCVGCVRRTTPGKPGSIFFDINTEEIQPMDNILHMNTDPTKWRLPSEETK